jgi:hypothetical protein
MHIQAYQVKTYLIEHHNFLLSHILVPYNQVEDLILGEYYHHILEMDKLPKK